MFQSHVLCSTVAIACTLLAGAARPACGQSPTEEMAVQAPAALAILERYHRVDPAPCRRPLHVVYWTPADREPAPHYRERLTRVLVDVRDFYAQQMEKLGLGRRTFRLDLQEDGLLRIHLVRGEKPYARYDVASGGPIREECLPTLRAAGIDASRETIAIFCNMSTWDEAARTMRQNGPYYAGGGLRSGTAWQVDSPLLDAALIGEKQLTLTDGQYGRISVGKYNSIFVGGVCHELGHAFGLPHNTERPEQRRFGTALMGSGNRTFGEERRGEGLGSFLTLAEGLRLAGQPLFSGSEKGIDLPPKAQLTELQVQPSLDGKSFTLAARVTAQPPAYAVVGYLDPAGGSDYDAATCTAVPDEQGRFSLHCTALRSGKSGLLRVVVCQANGGRIGDQTLALPYAVDAEGVVDLSTVLAKLQLAPLATAVYSQDAARVQEERVRVERWAVEQAALAQPTVPPASLAVIRAAALALAGTLDFQPGPAPAAAEGPLCRLSEARWEEAQVGWLRPMVNRLPQEEAALFVGGKLFARGLYAQAASRYRYRLAGQWKRLTGHAGLADGAGGSVVFVIRGDGQSLWRSRTVRQGGLESFAVDVSGVQELLLEVEDAGDGKNSDWGVWTDLDLGR